MNKQKYIMTDKHSKRSNTNLKLISSYTPSIGKKRKKHKQSSHSSIVRLPTTNIKTKLFSPGGIQTPTHNKNSVFRPPKSVITNHLFDQHLCKSPSPITEITQPLTLLENENIILREKNNALLNQLKIKNNEEKNLHQHFEKPTYIQDVSRNKPAITSKSIITSLDSQIKSISKNQVFKKVKFISGKVQLMDCHSKSSVGAYFLKCFTKMYPMDKIKDKNRFWIQVQDTVHQSICEKRGAVYNRFKKRWFGKLDILVM